MNNFAEKSGVESSSSAYQLLSAEMKKLSDLGHLQAITSWDEAVMMPPGGGASRANALATLAKLMHEIRTSEAIKNNIIQAKQEQLSDDWQKQNLALIEKNFKRAICVPAELVEKVTAAQNTSQQAWRTLREANDWETFKPYLKNTFSLVREVAEYKGQALGCDPYDAFIDECSPGFNQSIIDPIFSQLKVELPGKIQEIRDRQNSDAVSLPQGPFAVEQQRALGLELMGALGFDFNHGRLDVSHHPFCGGVPDDVRMTTRYNTNDFVTAAMGICHETGHARYEQGLPMHWRDQPVGKALGMAVHESQSLLIEMYACRSEAFMEFLAPLVQKYFGKQASFSAENLYKLYTRVNPGFIRVDADEVTYPLHVILRYELEQQLFNGDLSIDDLPEAWDQKMRQYFNLSTGTDYRNGVMQDVHWPAGIFGYFPAYTLGSLLAAQLFSAVNKEHPELSQQIAAGNFSDLFAWLQQHIHQRGSSVDVSTLIKDATGSTLSASFFLKHIEKRYHINS